MTSPPSRGGPVLIRFEYVTDAAVYRDGFMVADISIPQLDDGADMDGWERRGLRSGPRKPSPAVHSTDNRHRRGTAIPSIEAGPGRGHSGETTLSGLDAPGMEVVVIVSPITRDTATAQATPWSSCPGSHSAHSILPYISNIPNLIQTKSRTPTSPTPYIPQIQ